MTNFDIIDRNTNEVIGYAISLNGARRVVRRENAGLATTRYGYRAA